MDGLRRTVSWFLALFLCCMFVWFADQTLFPVAPGKNVFFPLLAEASGLAYFEPTGRAIAGILQGLCALFILIPWTRRFGAGLGALITAGAISAHLLFLGQALPVSADSVERDGGQVFYLSLGLLAACLCLLFVHPASGRRPG